jgi:membrane peptidoglycan carboxypeptidase
VLNSERRAGAASRISAAGRLAALSVGAGLLVAAVAVPLVGVTGIITRNAANTFNTLKVPSLGQIPSRSEFLDEDGNLIAYYYPHNIYRVPVTYDQIAPVMRTAIVAIEDSRFYLHGAFDLRGTVRALANDLSNSASTQGGSTLAQEYVKNALILTATSKQAQDEASEPTVSRKIRELRMAADVEHEMTKDELLAAYLNVAYYENNAYGIQVAAERYFSTSAADLTLPQAALLAGVVRNPSLYDPVTDPVPATDRRNTVLTRMAQLGYITNAQAQATEKLPLGLKMSTAPLQSGCFSASAASDAFFCDYVLSVMKTDPAFAQALQMLNTIGGLKIYTTLSPQDQRAANNAVNWVAPADSGLYNPGNNVDTEVLIQPGTGKIRALAIDRPYGTGPGHTTVDYAAETQYDGGTGVQTGSSSKIFTLITALKQGVPFGFNQAIVSPSVVGPYFNCQGNFAGVFNVHNAEGAGKGTFTLYNGTTQSINVFYAHLEQKVGLCQVVQTAASMGMTFANGRSLLRPDRPLGQSDSADNNPSFTLGSEPVAPMSMAAAYATVAAGGMYCSPIAITEILTSSGGSLPVQSASCHRAFSTQVAAAADYILQGVLTSPGTAAGRGISVPAAGKTGTANGGFYAAFGGFTPHLAGYVSVFNPTNPMTTGAMINGNACYREDPAFGGGENCPGQMFGDNAPAATWQMTFSNADVGPGTAFPQVPGDSPFFSMGNGINSPKPPKAPGGGKHGGGGGGGGKGGGNGGPPTAGPTVTPTTTPTTTTSPVAGPLLAPLGVLSLGVLPPARLP